VKSSSVAALLAAEMIAFQAEERAHEAWLEWSRQAVRRGVQCHVRNFDGVPLLLDVGGRKSMTTIRSRGSR
jgi:hypothetical protein